MKIFDTAFGSRRISLQIDFAGIHILYIPQEISFKECLIYLKDKNGDEYNREVVKVSSSTIYNMPQLSDGLYFLNLYNKLEKENVYREYLGRNNVPIILKNGILNFLISPVFIANKNVYVHLSSDFSFLYEKQLPSYGIQSDSLEIIKTAREITKDKVSSYQKVLAIHDWVAENIYYDMDVFYSRDYQKLDTTALGALTSRKSICQGYSNLSIALLRASRIPAIGMPCFALGISTDGCWEGQNLYAIANHQITLAHVENRWIIMDITWDSDNEYINGKFQKKTGIGVSHKYFDNTLAFISNTHHFIL